MDKKLSWPISLYEYSADLSITCEEKEIKRKIEKKRAETLRIVVLFERHRVGSKCRERRAKRPESDMSLSERPADDPGSEF